MNRPLFAALLLCAAGGVLAASPAGVKPGFWETTSEVTSPIHEKNTERRCVTQAQVRKFMSCYINHHYDCTCGTDEVAGGRVRFEGECVEKKSGNKVHIVGGGAYTDDTLSMTADARFHLLGLPVDGKASIEARRIGDSCPAQG
jgi:hypothetical protein